MSNLTRFEPAREMLTLREAMDQLFNEAFTRPFGLTPDMQAPSIDMFQTEDNLVVRAALPGVKAEDMQISVTGDLLTIKAEMKEKTNIKEEAYHIREQRYGSFERTLSLPSEVLADKAKAEFENGILTITLPKVEETRPKTITVKAK
ncbi:MAG: Hsp20/alpha crystallin family protein [Anaerolineales bacterium]|jgi:HSP20 family protein